MKKTPFIILLSFEYVAALISMGLLFSNLGILVYPIAIAVFSAVLAPFFFKLKKTTDEAKKEKIRWGIILIMLLPILAALIAIAFVVVALMLYYA